MSAPNPDAPARPHRFDAFRLANTGSEIAGHVDPYDLERIEDRLGDEEGEIPPGDVAYRIVGRLEDSGRAVLDVALEGTLPLECQRCMRVFDWPVQQDTTVLLGRDEDELAYLDDNDEREVVLAAGPLDPLDIVEDELLLTMPYVPRCDRPDCAEIAAALGSTGEDKSTSAFGALAALKREQKKDQ